MTLEELKRYKSEVAALKNLELIEELEQQTNEREHCKGLVIIKNLESALIAYGDAVIRIMIIKEEMQVRLSKEKEAALKIVGSKNGALELKR